MDEIYNNLRAILLSEMKEYYKPLTGLKKSCRAARHKPKEWWCETVEEKWAHLKKCEREYRKCSNKPQIIKEIRHNFNEAQRQFDKLVKTKKRNCLREKVKNIENANTTDPVAFWSYIQKLNPRKSKPIPMEVHIDGVTYTDENTVLSHWANEFKNLLTPPPMDEIKATRLEDITYLGT